MRIAKILHDKAHWIFEEDEIPNWPPDPEGNPIILIDITDKPEVQEGWNYDNKTGKFTEPIYVEPEGIIEELSIEEQILYETKYQTLLLEIGGI